MQPTKFAPNVPMNAGPSGTSGKATASLMLSISSLLCSCLTAIPGLIFGIIALSDISQSKGRLKGKGMAITAIVLAILFPLLNIGIAIGIMFLTVWKASEEFVAALEQVAQDAGDMETIVSDHRQIGLALHNYHDANRQFPGSPNSDSNALSWRVELLPYLEEDELFRQADKSQNYNVGSNAMLGESIPEIYYAPQIDFPIESTPYLAPVSMPGSTGPKFGFEGGAKLPDIRDGASNTVMLLYCDKSTAMFPWHQNRDLEIDPSNPTQGLEIVGFHYMVLMADGSSMRVRTTVSPEVMTHLLQRNDNNIIPAGTLE